MGVGLRWQDVDLKERTININHAMTYYPRRDDTYKCEFKVSLPKTDAGIRILPMMKQVYEALQGEYDRQKEEGFSEAVVDGMSGFIFINRFDTIHNPQAVKEFMNLRIGKPLTPEFYDLFLIRCQFAGDPYIIMAICNTIIRI